MKWTLFLIWERSIFKVIEILFNWFILVSQWKDQFEQNYDPRSYTSNVQIHNFQNVTWGCILQVLTLDITTSRTGAWTQTRHYPLRVDRQRKLLQQQQQVQLQTQGHRMPKISLITPGLKLLQVWNYINVFRTKYLKGLSQPLPCFSLHLGTIN